MISLDQDGRGLTDGEVSGLRRFVEEKRIGPASRMLGVSKETLARALARLPVHRKSIAQFRARFEKVGIHVERERDSSD